MLPYMPNRGSLRNVCCRSFQYFLHWQTESKKRHSLNSQPKNQFNQNQSINNFRNFYSDNVQNERLIGSSDLRLSPNINLHFLLNTLEFCFRAGYSDTQIVNIVERVSYYGVGFLM